MIATVSVRPRRRRAVRPDLRRLAPPALGALAALTAWHLVALAFFTRHELPLPGGVARQMWADRTFYGPHIRQTLGEAVVGFVWGVGIAMLLGVVFVVVPVVERVALRIVVATYCLPLIATAPILQIVLSPDAAKAAVAAQATLLVTLVGITLGLRAADPVHLDIVHCLGGGQRHKLVKVRLHAAVPGMFTGLKIAAPSALLGAVIGEFLGGTRGLGVAMITSQQAFFVERTWGLAIVMGALAALGFWALAATGRRLAPWQSLSTLNVGAAPGGGSDTSLPRRVGVSLGYLVLSVAVGLALWVGLVRLMDLSPFFAKGPADVWRFLFDGPDAAAARSELVAALRTTLGNAALGYLVGTVGALALAMVVVASSTVEGVVMPVAIWLRSVPLVAMTPLIAPVANGEVDGQMVFYVNEPAQLEVTGVETHSMLFADHGFALFGGCFAATTETIESQADLLAAFLRAEQQGWADALADPTYARDLTIEGLGADAGLDPDQQLLQAERMADLMVTDATEASGLLYLDEEDIAANLATLSAAGLDVAADDLFTTEILDRV